ncbi:MAG: MBL fold metallo-hydrolase [Chloroflexi bacterium]|nr:MBL fold metallo-hydrolase [Chloroflexota bacterium]
MLPITKIAENIFQVPVPVPFPLKTINCYLVRDDAGWAMIDTGLQYAPAHEIWEAAFGALDIHARDIRRIYLTHAHPDHYGLAGHFQNLTGAPVFLLDKEIEIVPFEWKPDGEHIDLIARFFESHGMPRAVVETVHERQLQVLAMVQPQPVLSALHQGECVTLGADSYRVVWVPGHADGHLVLHREADGLAFIGDHVLIKITPNIALWPGLDPNPLKNYLESLDKVERLAIRRALPGHRGVIDKLPERVAELRAHHAARLEECLNAANGCTAYEVCLRIFPGLRTTDELRMAMVETLSHLEYLVAAGKLEKREGEVVSYKQLK